MDDAQIVESDIGVKRGEANGEAKAKAGIGRHLGQLSKHTAASTKHGLDLYIGTR